MKRRTTNACRALVLTALAFASAVFSVAAANHLLCVEVEPRFAGEPLVFDAITNTTAAGQRISATRLDFLLSSIALRRANGSWLTASNRFAYLSGREGRTSFDLPGIPAGRYDRIRFNVGVPDKENHANPAGFAADHPLNPNVNGLHWSWQGGYVFLALEGNWMQPDGKTGGYSWHIATDRLLMTVELPVATGLSADRTLRLALNVDQIFSARHAIQISDETASTHSRAEDRLAGQLRENIERAFATRPLSPAEGEKAVMRETPASPRPLIASTATLYRFTYSRFFPQPALPPDNPLTEEGVALGRRLFHDSQLSVNNQQSCASCHQATHGFTDAKKFSLGAKGQIGTRNAMPLFNLAWRNSFFWDGRAPSLREQVLMPIENPIEMHETLTNLVAKLSSGSSRREEAHAPQSEIRNLKSEIDQSLFTSAATNQDYTTDFARAFGSPDITADRIARALEQFLLTLVSHGSKFDRSMAGEAELTEEEKRGFELFHTEYDPRRGQFGADCFHCHGGPLFQSQSFANNGLDVTFTDLGRHEVTKRDGDQGRFAAPSLRNIALTAPYMHDGRFATLEEVVEHYASGVKRSATLDPNLAKHPDGGVPLSAADKRALVAFLKTLTDETIARPSPSLLTTRRADK